jgi:hypothetical protein
MPRIFIVLGDWLPDQTSAVLGLHPHVQRLHAHMRDVIGEVVGREHGRGAFDGLVGVAGIDHRNARLAPVGGDRAIVLQHAIIVVGLCRRRF